MKNELKPCPFCGSKADAKKDIYGRNIARCARVNCAAHRFWWDISDWNSRPTEDALRAENKSLQAIVEAARKYITALEKYMHINHIVTTKPIEKAAAKWEALK
jgi:hypothetical protein